MASEQPLTFAQLLKHHRITAGLTQEALAERAGLAVRSISDLERGLRHSPYADTLGKLADALELSTAEGTQFQAAARRSGGRQPRPTDADDDGPLTAPAAGPHNLPVQPTALLGREEEVRQVVAALRRADARLVTLTGPGGIGKTRLAFQIAADLLGDFADGVWLVPLSRLTDPSLVLPAVAQTLGVSEQGGRPLLETLRAHLRDKRLLLLLDNFEQVVGAAGEVGALLGSAPALKLLVTSRVPLRLRGEQRFPVPPLALAQPGRIPSSDHLTRYAAEALFVERAGRVRPDFAVTAANAAAIAEICARLDGLPLAIELAATRIAVLSPEALLARLSGRLKLLTGGARDVDERQQTMRATLAWSEDLLGPEEQRLFRRLAVFVGGCTLEAAEAVCIAPEGAEPLGVDLLDSVESLVEQSLVQRREEGGETRFGMLHVIREFALERLEASGEGEALRRAHAAHFLALVEQAEPELTRPEAAIWLDRLEREHDNLRAALAWAQEQGEAERGLRLVAALFRFWWARGHLREGRAWAEGLLMLEAGQRAEAVAGTPGTARGGVGARLRARALLAGGGLAMDLDEDATARTWLEQAAALARTAGDRHTTARVLNSLGMVAVGANDLERAETRYAESLALNRELDDRRGIAVTLNNLGDVAVYQGDLERATVALTEALALARELGDRDHTAMCLQNLGRVAHKRGEVARAETLQREALVLFRDLGDPRHCSEALERLAGTAGAARHGERAARLLGAVAAVRATLGTPQPALERAETDAAVAPARAALGENAWAAAFAAGRALPLEQAIAEALQVSPYGNFQFP
jgi:predicted ATPase/transcriptional regulator with XRE-family HTH domain